MTTPLGPEPGQSLEDWVRESLLGPLPGEPASDTPADRPDAPPPVVPAQRAAPPSPPPVVVPAQRVAPPAGAAEPEQERLPDDRLPDERQPDERRAADAVTAAGGQVAASPVVPALPSGPRRRRRFALGAATGVAAAVGLAMVTLTPAPPLQAPTAPGLSLDATAAPRPAVPGTPAPVDGAVLASVVSTPVPAAVPVAFAGRRVDVGGGWWIGVTRPYLCPVLMTVPALMSGDSRLVRMTITIVNDTGSPQPAHSWTLRATADGRPVEMVLWPSAGFRGVPDRLLAQGERVRFLVAVRLPAQRAAVEVTAVHPSGVRAALTGKV